MSSEGGDDNTEITDHSSENSISSIDLNEEASSSNLVGDLPAIYEVSSSYNIVDQENKLEERNNSLTEEEEDEKIMEKKKKKSASVRRYIRSKMPRLRWTPDLHLSFVHAIHRLGGQERATPKAVLQLMNVREDLVSLMSKVIYRSKKLDESGRVIGQGNRHHYIQGRNNLSATNYFNKYYCSPIHQLKLENGGIVFARNSNQHQWCSSYHQESKVRVEAKRWPVSNLSQNLRQESRWNVVSISSINSAANYQDKSSITFQNSEPFNLDHHHDPFIRLQMNEEKKMTCKERFTADLQLSLSLGLSNISNDHNKGGGDKDIINTKLSLGLSTPHSSSTAT